MRFLPWISLAEAESRVHGVPKAEARFHEIGALDALADIAGSCAARQSLAVERVFSRPVSVGSGFVQSAHGLLAVPGPAALEILRAHKIPWKGGPVEEELLTPTGAALLATLVDEFVPDFPLIRAEKVGYGAGKRELSPSQCPAGHSCGDDSRAGDERKAKIMSSMAIAWCSWRPMWMMSLARCWAI